MRHLAAAAALTLVGAALRLPRLIETPGWDGDEGYNLEIAWQLAHGQAQAFAVSQSFVQHPIAFYALLAPLVGVFGRELAVARALTAAASSVAAGVLYLAACRSIGVRAAFLAALSFAGADFIVLHNRLAYTYNVLLLFSALTLWLVARYEAHWSRGRLAGAAVVAALGLLTDHVGIALPLFVAARAVPRSRDVTLALVIGVTPAAFVALAMAAISPEAAADDWSASLGRLGGGTTEASVGPASGAARWFVNYLHLLRAEWWWPAAVVGLFCIPDVAARRRVLTLAALLVLPTFALRELEPFFRTGIALFVPGALGLGALLDAGLSAVFRTVPSRLARSVTAAFVVLLPLGLELARSAGAVATTFQTRFDWALVTDQSAARAAAQHVNTRVTSDDLVLISPHVAWLYRGRTADFFQAVAWTGQGVAFYPPRMAQSRFVFEPSVDAARYAVVDPFWLRWADASPPLAAITARILAWPEELRVGEVSVRRNPR